LSIENVSLPVAWERLGGGAVHGGRGRAFWRDGDGLNVAVDLERGLWFDHATSLGGGVLQLVETTLDCGRREALEWLEAQGLIEPRRLCSQAERRAFGRRRDAAHTLAHDIAWWAAARAVDLEVAKVRLFAPGMSLDDRRRAIRAARELHRLESADAEGVARLLFAHRHSDPEAVEQLIASGRAREIESRLIAAACTAVLARAESPEAVRHAA
jgi:hypothetical protein